MKIISALIAAAALFLAAAPAGAATDVLTMDVAGVTLSTPAPEAKATLEAAGWVQDQKKTEFFTLLYGASKKFKYPTSWYFSKPGTAETIIFSMADPATFEQAVGPIYRVSYSRGTHDQVSDAWIAEMRTKIFAKYGELTKTIDHCAPGPLYTAGSGPAAPMRPHGHVLEVRMGCDTDVVSIELTNHVLWSSASKLEEYVRNLGTPPSTDSSF